MNAVVSAALLTVALLSASPDEIEERVAEVRGYTEDELYCMAAVIYNEAGGDACCDECRYRVGDIVLNRAADERFPNTIREVIEQPGQYAGMGGGVKFAARHVNPGEAHAVERAYETARAILGGERHSELYGAGYVWQATFMQGRDNVRCCGHWYGR